MKTNNIFCVCILLLTACSRDAMPTRDFRANMRDAQQLSNELFSYVWNPTLFNSKNNEPKISALLKELSKDFHEVKKTGTAYELEPGFQIVLSTQRELLKNISSRFNNGQKDYALWKLKGMGQNCIACHSRLNVPYDFFGDVTVKSQKTIEGEFSEAEFLFASRKFDQASKNFLEIAQKSAKLPGQSDFSISALKYWLLIEVRVKSRLSEAADSLNKLVKAKLYDQDRSEILNNWVEDLLKANQSQETLLANMPDILAEDQNINENREREFVANIRATSILHEFLDSNPLSTKRKRALLNLGATYLKIPLPSLSVFGPMYLEQTIREYPKTKEAKLSYKLYKQNLEIEFTGSGGLNIDSQQKAKLDYFKKLSGSK